MRWSGAWWFLMLCIGACSDSGGGDPGTDDGMAGRGGAGAPGAQNGGSVVGSPGAGATSVGSAGASAPAGGTTLDRDGDGVPNADDAFPDDPDESIDTDRDGVGDDSDVEPDNLLSCADGDGDGCDDCVTGRSNPDQDGPDADADGACDACDAARCNARGVCRASATVAECECDAPWSGDDCTEDADACAVADPVDDNPCNVQDTAARCNDDAAPAATYSCACGSGHVFDGVTCVPASGFLGDEVSAMMPTLAAGPLFMTGTTAIVGPGVEFSSRNEPGLGGVDLDVAADSFTLSLVNGHEGAFNQGLVRIEITDLQSVEEPSAVITSVTVTSSTFPADTFDAISFGPHSITLDVSEPNLLVPGMTTWSATFAVELAAAPPDAPE
jgi:hypothetical protein